LNKKVNKFYKMKTNIIIILIFLISIECCTNNSLVECNNIFPQAMQDSTVVSVSQPFLRDGLCCQYFLFNGNKSEYGYSNLFKDTLILTRQQDKLCMLKKSNKTGEKIELVPFFDCVKVLNTKFDENINDTIYRIAVNAEIFEIVDTNRLFVALIGAKSGFHGMYILDKTPLILKNYNMPIIRSMKGDIYLYDLDTTKIKISYKKSTGVYL